jgi:iron complex outermembrane receptor protein
MGHSLSLDIATFGGVWRNLSEVVPGQSYFSAGPQPYLIIPLIYENSARGRSFGGEIFATWKIASHWKFMPGYSFSHIEVDGADSNGSGNSGATTPRNQLQIRSQVDLKRRFEWDTSLSYTGALGDTGGGATPGYTRLDVRIAKRFGEATEFSVTGQNLLTPRHAEFGDEIGNLHVLVPRGIFARLAFRF